MTLFGREHVDRWIRKLIREDERFPITQMNHCAPPCGNGSQSAIVVSIDIARISSESIRGRRTVREIDADHVKARCGDLHRQWQTHVAKTDNGCRRLAILEPNLERVQIRKPPVS